MLSWFRRRAQIRFRRKSVQNVAGMVREMESRTLLAGITYTAGATTLDVVGTTGDDTITVSSNGTNFLVNGTDTGFAIAGRNFINVTAGDGNDTVTIDASLGAGRTSFVTGGIGNDTLNGGLGADNLNGGAGADSYSGGDGSDNITIDGDDTTVVGGNGYDQVLAAAGSAGLNLVLTAGAAVEYISGSANDDVINAAASTVSVFIFGGDGNDTITGGTLGDQLQGGNGNDTLNGGDGNDTLLGQAGADSFDGGNGNDNIQIDELDTSIIGGAGVGDVAQAIASGAGLNIVLVAGAGIEVLSGTNNADTIDASAQTTSIQITALGGDDVITTGAGNDTVYGGAGDDTIVLGNGNNTAYGEAGDDTFTGGTGTDTTGYNNSPSGVFVDVGAGVAADGWGGVDTFTAFENVVGSQSNDQLVGDGGNNLLNGLGGDDILQGFGGQDSLLGGLGNDNLDGGNGNDNLQGENGNDTLTGGAGSDTTVGGSGIDTIIYQGSAAGVTVNLFTQTASGGDATGDSLGGLENVIGSESADNITGSAVANRLEGRGGNDTILGGAGDDSLYGGDGNDILHGGFATTAADGTDLYDGGANDDTINAESGEAAVVGFTGGTGTDTLQPKDTTIAVNWVLGSGGIERVFGSNAGDTIDFTGASVGVTVFAQGGSDNVTGGTGNDSIIGSDGLDTLFGGDGNDTIGGGNDADTLIGGAGSDRLTGGAGDDELYAFLIGNDDDGVFDNLQGESGLDILHGTPIQDSLFQ
jgi:Ca2+-binding RTX toxin-like protein